MFPLFSKIFRAKAEFYNSVGVLSRFLGPWSYIADVCQKYFGGELNSIILGGLINQRLGLFTRVVGYDVNGSKGSYETTLILEPKPQETTSPA